MHPHGGKALPTKGVSLGAGYSTTNLNNQPSPNKGIQGKNDKCILSDSIDRKFKEIKTRLAAAWGQESGTWGEVRGKGIAKRHKGTLG